MVLLASCSNLGSTTSRTACRIQLLLQEATSAVERGIAAHVEGDAVEAAQAGTEATSKGAELHSLLSFALGLSTDVLADLESAAINAQQIGAYLASPAGDAQSEVDLSKVLDAMKGTAARWAATVRGAGVTCE